VRRNWITWLIRRRRTQRTIVNADRSRTSVDQEVAIGRKYDAAHAQVRADGYQDDLYAATTDKEKAIATFNLHQAQFEVVEKAFGQEYAFAGNSDSNLSVDEKSAFDKKKMAYEVQMKEDEVNIVRAELAEAKNGKLPDWLDKNVREAEKRLHTAESEYKSTKANAGVN